MMENFHRDSIPSQGREIQTEKKMKRWNFLYNLYKNANIQKGIEWFVEGAM